MKIVMISDTHNVPEMDLRKLLYKYEGDLLIHAGDHNVVNPNDKFDILSNIKQSVIQFNEVGGFDNKIAVAGNHEPCLDKKHELYIDDEDRYYLLGTKYKELIDKTIITKPKLIKIDGVVILATPTSPEFFNWGFQEEKYYEELMEIYDNTDKIDVIVAHSPPAWYGDRPRDWNGNYQNKNVGSILMGDFINKFTPKLFVCGHIHGSYGIWDHDNGITKVVNASIVDESYLRINKPIVIEIDF